MGMNIDYDKLSTASVRELLKFHPVRQVVRHFEARGYQLDAIAKKVKLAAQAEIMPVDNWPSGQHVAQKGLGSVEF